MINWDYIAGFFDGEGNINVSKTKNYKNGEHNITIAIRIYQTSRDVLEKIKDFIGYGTIYENKRTNSSWNNTFELTFNKKDDVKTFLITIKDKVITKKEQVNYVLENYDFGRVNNQGFDVDKFRSFITRKGVEKSRKLHTE